MSSTILGKRPNSVKSGDDNHTATSYSGDTCLPRPSPLEQEITHGAGALSTCNEDTRKDDEALKPDPGAERDFDVENNKFAFSPGHMSKLLKSLSAFRAVGGLAGLEKGLRTNRKYGLSSDETVLEGYVSFEEATTTSRSPSKAPLARPFSAKPIPSLSRDVSDERFADRKRVFGDNQLPAKQMKNIFQIMWVTYNDQVLILLTVAAIISLGIGLYQTFDTVHTPTNPPVEWIEGVAIIVAIVVIVVVGSVNDYQKERQFAKLYEKKQDRNVKVIRSGKSQEISVLDILVGDVVHIEPGDVLPVDGIFIDGYNVKCDESSTTGESHLSPKHSADAVFQAIEEQGGLPEMDPFLSSDAKVAEGIGTFLVTATGVNSSHGKTLKSLQEDPEVTPLQSRLNTLAEYIAKFGGAVALLLFIVLFIEFLARLPQSTYTPAQKGRNFVNIIIITLTVVVIAVPEGLPLAVTLALAFATIRMLKDHNLVRRLRSCETMGNATYICSDKTGTLTKNEMMVVEGIVGTMSRFFEKKWQPPGSNNLTKTCHERPFDTGFDVVPAAESIGCPASDTKKLLGQSIIINSTAFEGERDGQQVFIGSSTEAALLSFAREYLGVGWASVELERSRTKIVQLISFDSTRQYMATIVELENGRYRLYIKGAPEILLKKCTRIIHDPTKGISDARITTENNEYLNWVITEYATRSLRTIGLFYRDFEQGQWLPNALQMAEDDKAEAVSEDFFENLVFLGIFGIQDPLRDGVREAVQTCQKAGVVVCMVTGDNISTAKAIAKECGILSSAEDIAMHGSEFSKLSLSQMDHIIPRLRVLARSTPRDKQTMVARLKHLGHIVAVTGDGTNDALALKTADVGFSMGISGTEVAKEASDIILMDDNFSSLVKAITWGRTINDAVRKFLQFQVTVSVTTVGLTFVSAVVNPDEQSVLTAVQLMWVNLIQDTMAALALATDPPAPSILERKPDPKTAPLISVTMWKMIIGQSIYQLAVTLTLNFAGAKIFSYQSAHEISQLQTVVFNTFVWMQIFNQFNNRRLDNKFNIFEGISHNWLFIAISLVMMGCQVMIIFVGGRAFSITRLDGSQWAYSVVLGALSIPVGVVIRLIPDAALKGVYQHFLRWQTLAPADIERQFEFPQPLEEIRQELTFLKKVRGGRLNNLKSAIRSPSKSILPRLGSGLKDGSTHIAAGNPPAGSGAQTQGRPAPESHVRRQGRSRPYSAFGPAAAVAGVIAGSIAGWYPIQNNGDTNLNDLVITEDPQEQLG